MKQITQNMRSGQLAVTDVPAPLLRDEGILVHTRASLVSAGTERMMLELARKSVLGKARERPDLVRKVLDKIKRDGLMATLKTVREKLDSDMPMGYSACGEILEVGARATEFQAGGRVACAGAGFANHAEVNYIPRLLAARVPEGISDEAAAYTTVGTIALQGVRNAEVNLGQTVAVLGLGLIGQLTVQLLKAAGCRVVGLDLSPARVELAANHGADLAIVAQDASAEAEVMRFTRGRGVDAVLITAATESNAPVEQAARIARDRGRVVMVGVTGMDLPRRDYFEKELSFVVSRSYGPGRYDPSYEQQGHDYPIGYVRWTENRNFEAFLDLVAAGKVRPEVCTTHRFPIAEAEAAYEMILSGSEPHLGVILTYPQRDTTEERPTARIDLPTPTPAARKATGQVGVSFVGAGGFARGVHLPNMAARKDVALRGIVDASGIAARSAGTKFGFAFCASQEQEILDDPETDLIILTTPHSQHADGICRALAAGKSVLVEKPLAINMEQLDRVRQAIQAHPQGLMVGFNRRFSPLAAELKDYFHGAGPLMAVYRCNAGPVPAEHWIADPAEGGRIIGEACHFFDLFAYLTDAKPLSVTAAAPSGGSADDAAVTVHYADGSVGQLCYTSLGAGSFSKERLEVFSGGRTGVLEDFRRLELHGGKRRRRKLMTADKGHTAELAAVVDACRAGTPMPISLESLVETTLVSFAALRSARCGEPVGIE